MTELRLAPLAAFEQARRLNASAPERAALFATLARLNTLYMIARAGSGHIGSSFSSLDIVTWLHLEEMRLDDAGDAAADIYFSSKGHDVPGLYAVLIGLGRLPFDGLDRLRRLGGLPGHPDVATPGVATNTGSLGMGVAKAKGMALANRLAGQPCRLYVLTGDGELQEGQFWESLQPTSNLGLDELTVIIDHNRIQSDTWVADTSDLGDLDARIAAHGWHVARCDGHDLNALAEALADARAADDRPSAIIAETVKGAGVSFMEGRALPEDGFYRYHSGAPSVADYDRAADELAARAAAQFAALGAEAPQLVTTPRQPPTRAAPTDRLVDAYSRALLAAAEAEPKLVALDADLILDTGLIPFRDRHPERFFECGIAEQDMVSSAGGMARRGLKPVVHSFACFLTPRANEQIYNNATEGTQIVYVGSLAGVLPGGSGHSHQSVRDLALMASIPGMTLVEPAIERETEAAADFLLRAAAGSGYLRLCSIPVALEFALPDDYALLPGRGTTLTEGADAVLFAYGPVMLNEAVGAAALLRDDGVALRVIDLPWLNTVDADWLSATVAGCRRAFTLDNHVRCGGQGEMLAATLAERADAPPVTRFALDDVPVCGTNDEVLGHHGLDRASLAAAIAAALEGR